MAQELQGKPENRGRFDDTDGRIRKCQNKMDKMNRFDLADSLRLLKKMTDEAELVGKERLQEVAIRKVLEQHVESWEAHGEEH